ncbi:hypothetical protein [Granulosicoccus antarcticus]|uniref:Uncharacterized protein n=1 Tax=Granulosicoccus antarcticus IMCC3135 TaxID=1192854 RepID=A0A2Z2NUL8_9GAMM|nr:hypothetical protein [Granulosicoccus antarcticus]ASJ70784.1 hypothetical protein IMCC3135_03355 [Granulosicoccus antarcticus IMCC3135]
MNQLIRNPVYSQALPTPQWSWQRIHLLVCILSVLAVSATVYGPRVSASSDVHSELNSDIPTPAAALSDTASLANHSSSFELPSIAKEVDADHLSPQTELITRLGAVNSARIVMHATESTARLAGQISTLFSALGADQVQQRIVDTVPEHNQIRYYHPADREAGQVVGDVMRLVFDDISIEDFEDYQPSPSEGLIEIWLR